MIQRHSSRRGFLSSVLSSSLVPFHGVPKAVAQPPGAAGPRGTCGCSKQVPLSWPGSARAAGKPLPLFHRRRLQHLPDTAREFRPVEAGAAGASRARRPRRPSRRNAGRPLRPGLDASQSPESTPGPGPARWIGSTVRVASRLNGSASSTCSCATNSSARRCPRRCRQRPGVVDGGAVGTCHRRARRTDVPMLSRER